MINPSTHFPFPTPGALALAQLGPAYAPGERIQVKIIAKASLDSWLCKDERGVMLTVRTAKLSRLDPAPP